MPNLTIRTYQCPNCQTDFAVYLPHSQYFGCPHCRVWIQLSAENLPFVVNPPAKFEDNLSFIKISLGMKAIFDNKTYQVVARSRWASNFVEYYETQTEDGLKTGYKNKSSKYDLWRLQNIDEDNGFWLVQTDKEFYFSQAFFPANDTFPNEKFGLFANFVNNYPLRITEYGTANLRLFEGETDELPLKSLQNILKYYGCNWGNDTYLAEIEMNKESYQNVSPPQYFKQTPVKNNRAILEAFAQNPSIQKTLQNAKNLIFSRNLSIVAFVVLVGFFLFSFQEKKTVFQDSYSFGENDTLPKFTPSFELKNQTYLLELEGQIATNNGDTYITAELYDDEEDLLVNEMGGDFWYYSGVEDGEFWAERQDYTYQYVSVADAGPYSAEFFVDSKLVSGNLVFRVREAGFIWYYALIPLIISILAFTILQIIISVRGLE
jgi:hypothetical protein